MAVEQAVVDLQPGGISKPIRVWCGSNSVRIGFFQAYPISPSFNIFYKKTGSVFGSEITTQSSAIIGPDLSVKQPTSIMAQYFEMEIRKLKPNTQYLIKVKTDNIRVNARSDKIATISIDEQRTRDQDMANFAGSLVKLGDHDGSVLRFDRETGLFDIRILQVDNVQTASQLVRLQSDYSDNGLPVNAYTLSQVKFGRWGGEISSSKIVSEGELKWIVARAVQMEERSESQEGYEARMKVLQLQTEKMQSQLQAESRAQVKKLRLHKVLLLVLASFMAVLLFSATTYSYIQASARQRNFRIELDQAQSAAVQLQTQVDELQLYRLSLELDTAWRLRPGDNCTAWQEHLAAISGTTPAGGPASPPPPQQNTSTGGSPSVTKEASIPHKSRRPAKGAVADHGGSSGVRGSSGAPKGSQKGPGGKAKTWSGSPGSGAPVPPEMRRLMGEDQIKRMLRRSHRPPSEFKASTTWTGPVPEEEPHAWSFIHQVSNQYALYVQEWMKVQLSKAIRDKVNDMLPESAEEAIEEDDDDGVYGGGY